MLHSAFWIPQGGHDFHILAYLQQFPLHLFSQCRSCSGRHCFVSSSLAIVQPGSASQYLWDHTQNPKTLQRRSSITCVPDVSGTHPWISGFVAVSHALILSVVLHIMVSCHYWARFHCLIQPLSPATAQAQPEWSGGSRSGLADDKRSLFHSEGSMHWREARG